ncbi:MAG: 23S rRNA (adenine(2503)-C(2))-methyltransferase RlmN [Thermodesulfobacteriota bacterium]
MKNLKNFTHDELAGVVKALGEKPYRVAQLYGWLFAKGAQSVDDMTDLPGEFREALKERFCIRALELIEIRTSSDGTMKLLLGLEDGEGGEGGERIESVIIPEGEEGRRLTLCVSTQTGCALGCVFCMTGTAGPGRDLTLSEMVGQVEAARSIIVGDGGERITNVVLMGMGEPLLNYDEVLKFLGVLTDPKGLGYSPGKVTLSTAGVVPGIEKLGGDMPVNLAVSLNATTDEVRDRLMPINKKYPLKLLMAALREYPLKRRGHITMEYVLIKGVNDAPADARRLVNLLHGIPCKINLIPFNPFPGSEYERPDDKSVKEFQGILVRARYTAVVRTSRGADIEAACGQLRGRRGERGGGGGGN